MCGLTVRYMVERSVGNVMSAKKMFYSMGEVSEMFDVNPSLIRHWESKFDCLRPHKNKKGNRLFSPSDVEKLKQIYHLVKERGMTLEGANKAMKSSRGVLSRDTELLERLQRIRAALVARNCVTACRTTLSRRRIRWRIRSRCPLRRMWRLMPKGPI